MRTAVLEAGKPETFDFLGFKHHCATRRNGSGFVLGRKPMAKRMRTKLREIKEQLMATRHDGIDAQGKWLAQVLRGWMAYYAVPMSAPAITAFRHHMIDRWLGALRWRGQQRRLAWTRMKMIANRYLPYPSHPASVARTAVPRHSSKVGARCGSSARRDLCGGRQGILRPYRDRPERHQRAKMVVVETPSEGSRPWASLFGN